jgi:hypothetical protein
MDHLRDNPTPCDFTSLLSPANRIRLTTIPSRLRFTWFCAEKALTSDQKTQAAEPFGAAGSCLTVAKKLIDVRHPVYQALTALRGKIEAHWQNASLPFPEPCVRLLPLDRVHDFERQMREFSSELADAASELGRVYDDLRHEAEGRLGALFDPADYPATPENLFDVAWDFPNFAAPPLNAGWVSQSVYDLEELRIRTRYETAISLAETGFREEFTRLVAHLCERIADPDEEATPKIFRDTSVVKLVEFTARYFRFNLRTDDRLDELIILAEHALRGVTPQGLRSNQPSRQLLATRLSWIKVSLDALRNKLLQEELAAKTWTTSGALSE